MNITLHRSKKGSGKIPYGPNRSSKKRSDYFGKPQKKSSESKKKK